MTGFEKTYEKLKDTVLQITSNYLTISFTQGPMMPWLGCPSVQKWLGLSHSHTPCITSTTCICAITWSCRGFQQPGGNNRWAPWCSGKRLSPGQQTTLKVPWHTCGSVPTPFSSSDSHVPRNQWATICKPYIFWCTISVSSTLIEPLSLSET